VLFRCGSRTCSVHASHASPFPRAPVFSLYDFHKFIAQAYSHRARKSSFLSTLRALKCLWGILLSFFLQIYHCKLTLQCLIKTGTSGHINIDQKPVSQVMSRWVRPFPPQVWQTCHPCQVQIDWTAVKRSLAPDAISILNKWRCRKSNSY